VSIEIRGANQLATLARDLREAGRKDLQKELGQAINRAMRPVKDDVRQSAGTLPHHGGLAAEVAASKLTVRRRSSRGTAGLRLVARNRLSLYHLNQGEVRHRKGGKIGAGRVQRIRPGWWTRPTEGAAPEVRRELTKAMNGIARKIGRR
jgi:hypothetical protein